MVSKAITGHYADLFREVCSLFGVKSLGGIFVSQCLNTRPSPHFYARLLTDDLEEHPLVGELLLTAIQRFDGLDLIEFYKENPEVPFKDVPYIIAQRDETVAAIVIKERKKKELKAKIEALDKEDVFLNPAPSAPVSPSTLITPSPPFMTDTTGTKPPFPSGASHE